ncbi:MAG: hypothetical protein A2V77_07010 [Anaeromyxobacter sp. RBG_16_69_14]|nr:MAG: hypothetical protein A2V77_07010 [Anaeromyxobacter sp. RBG_16_69_14]
MSPRSYAIVLRRRDPPSLQIFAAELRLAGLLDELATLEAEVETLARELAAFEARYLEVTGEAFAELDRAERLVRRVRRVADEVARLQDLLRRGPPEEARSAPRVKTAAAARRSSSSRSPAGERSTVRDGAPPGLDDEEIDLLGGGDSGLKALYRRLARFLHPDLVRGDEAERTRRSELMASANDGYRRGDRAALELLAERVGAAGSGDVSEAERLVHLVKRIAAVEAARTRLAAQHARLAVSRAARLRAEVPRRAGGNVLAEARAAAEEGGSAARGEALARLGKLVVEARALGMARRTTAAKLAAAGRRGVRRAWDPVAQSPVLRRQLARRGARRPTPAASALSRALEKQAGSAAPWEAALTLLAFLGEEVGCLPEPLASWDELAERWDALRAGWPGAPDLGRALAVLPGHLEIGLRLCEDEVEAGLQLASADLAAGVRAALGHETARGLAQRVMAALGPRERCGECGGEVYAVHLLRVHGLDEVHGLACPRCAAVLRSFLRYGEPQGLEALSALAVEIGLVAEQPVRFGGVRLAFQMLPAERARLTGRALLRRFRGLCLEPHGLDLPRGALELRAGRARLAPGARVPEGASVSVVALSEAGMNVRELLDVVRKRIERRFRA